MKSIMKSKYLNIFCQTILFILLFGQGTLIYLSLRNTGIPIPDSIIQKYIPQDLNFSSKKILFLLPHHLKIIEPEFTQKASDLFLFKSREIFISLEPNYKNLVFNQWNIYSYSGTLQSTLYPEPLDLKGFKFAFKGSRIKRAELLLQSNDKIINLNYSAVKFLELHNNFQEIEEPLKQSELLLASYKQGGSTYSIINAVNDSKNTFIQCFAERALDNSLVFTTEISSDSIALLSNKLQALQLKSKYSSLENFVSFNAENFSNPKISLKTNSLMGKLKLDNKMQANSIEIHANAFSYKDKILDTISVKALFDDVNSIPLTGYIFHQNHVLNISTDYQVDALDNEFSINAHLDPNELKNIYFPQFKELSIYSTKPFYLDSKIILDKNINLLAAKGYMQGEDLMINKTPVRYSRSDFKWIDKKLSASTYCKINNRKLYTQADFDSESGDYSCTIYGTVFSSDFNSVLPKWWENIFKKFSYTDHTVTLNDFAINGNTNFPIPDLFLGSLQTENIIYQGVPIKYGDLLIKGMNYCTEITLKNVKTETGKAEGVIKITTKPDAFKKPESVRINLRSELTINTAQKLFGERVKRVLSYFESPYLHKVNIEGVFFNSHYTQHHNKSYYNLSINSENPFLFSKRPFAQAYANIYGRNNQHFIRKASTEFADGSLNIEADILETLSDDPKIRLNLKLAGSDYSKAIQHAFQNNLTGDEFGEQNFLSLDLTLKSQGSLLDLTKHDGFGNLAINGEGLAKIHLLGPFSKALDELNLSVGVFSLNRLNGNFLIQKEWIDVQTLEINGTQSHVFGKGKVFIPDQTISFKVKVDLLKNRNLSFSNLGNIGKLLNPITNILNFSVKGTLQDQKWRSRYDPRNLFQ